jgi:acetylornithine deacetylase/succinyl-diaminopimelate desuccinylase-like protein
MRTEPQQAVTPLPAACAAVDRARLLDTAVRLIARPSPTGAAGAAADELAAVLEGEGFAVERPAAGHPAAPAVVARLSSGRPGRTLQFNGHLDTVHLPFVPPHVSGDRLTGSGAADMKGGIAAAVEAMRAVRDAGGLAGGEILLTAHDLHEAPWGEGRQ